MSALTQLSQSIAHAPTWLDAGVQPLEQIQITPIPSALGAVVTGIDTRQPQSAAVIQALKIALHQHLILVFKKQSLTKHDITGAMLQAGVQSYFALNDTQDRIAQANSSIVHNTLMSFGTFSTYIQPKQVYGLTTAARLSGMMMDIDRLGSQAVDKDNQRDNLVAYMSAQGPRQSANEHLIPEALFDDPATAEKEVEAVSAVKAIQLAAQQGQKIFTINQDNLSQVLPQLSHKATVIQDVKNAVAAGKIVTISQTMISYKGWTGTGYILLDPNTGAGAYLIGGGMDGALFFIFGAWLTMVVLLGIIEVGFITFTTLGAGGIVAYPLLILQITAIVLMMKSMAQKYSNGDEEKEKFLYGCFVSGAVFGLNGFVIEMGFSKITQLLFLIIGGGFSVPNAKLTSQTKYAKGNFYITCCPPCHASSRFH